MKQSSFIIVCIRIPRISLIMCVPTPPPDLLSSGTIFDQIDSVGQQQRSGATQLLSHVRSLIAVGRMANMARIGFLVGCCIAFFGPEMLEIIGTGERGRLILAQGLVRNIVVPG
jgi:hypothetical protein